MNQYELCQRFRKKMRKAMRKVVVKAIAAGVTEPSELDYICEAGSDDQISDLIYAELAKHHEPPFEIAEVPISAIIEGDCFSLGILPCPLSKMSSILPCRICGRLHIEVATEPEPEGDVPLIVPKG